MSIPADLVKLYSIKSGDPLDVDIVPGGFITRPRATTGPKRLTLAELLQGVDKEFMAPLNAETGWIRDGAPVGREFL